jgi:maltose O-acetyltransferase
VKLYSFVKLELLRWLSDLEFRYHKNNTHVRFRERYLRALGVEFQAPISLGTDFYLRDHGRLKIGRNCSFGSFTRIWNYVPVEIGDHFLSAGGLTINCGSHDPNTLQPSAREVKIGHRVWIGLNVTILGGVTIGDDVVVGAGSVVTKNIPAGTVWAGVPAKKIKDVDREGLTSIWGGWGDISLPPIPPEALVDRANARMASGNFAGARITIERALVLRPGDPALLVLLAGAMLQLGLVAEFEKAMADALSAAPTFAPAHRFLGELLLSSGQPDAAAHHFEVVVQQERTDTETRLKLGRCYKECGLHQEAVRVFEDVLRLSPGNQDAMAGLSGADPKVSVC